MLYVRNPGLKWLLCFWLVFQFSGCSANIHRWSEAPPDRETLSLKERKEAVQRYQIKEIDLFFSSDRLVIGSESPPIYLDESTYSFMVKVSPKSQKYFFDLKNNFDSVIWLGLSAGYLAITAYAAAQFNSLNDNSEQRWTTGSFINTGTLIGTSIMMLIGGFLYFQRWDAANHLKETYNADLKRYYLPEGGNLDSLIPAPHLTVAPSAP